MTWEQSGDRCSWSSRHATQSGRIGQRRVYHLLLEVLLAGWTEHWQVILGPLLIVSVIFFRRGLAGMFYKPDA